MPLSDTPLHFVATFDEASRTVDQPQRSLVRPRRGRTARDHCRPSGTDVCFQFAARSPSTSMTSREPVLDW